MYTVMFETGVSFSFFNRSIVLPGMRSKNGARSVLYPYFYSVSWGSGRSAAAPVISTGARNMRSRLRAPC